MPQLRRSLVALLLPCCLTGCSNDSGLIRGSGTIEMDEIDVASIVGGRLVRLAVSEGDTVSLGDTLAVLDRGEIAAELAAQAAQAQRAQSQARDLQQGARPAELVIAREQARAAQADLELAQVSYDRTERLAKSGVTAPAELDRARAVRDAARARAASANEQVRLQEDGYRRQQINAAQQGATAAMAQLAGARSRANELVLTAPRAGVVLMTNYDAGELVPPSAAVLTLGDPDSLWMRVYVAAPKLTMLRVGASAEVRPVGVKQPFHGRVVSIASEAEFTPRAALTEEEQANLVFGVKLTLDRTGGALKAGLPADARIQPAK
ncbi:MAG: efflux RND transporter periplasmic adaptor subunit [Candidatus Eisenbacteria bacterium]